MEMGPHKLKNKVSAVYEFILSSVTGPGIERAGV